MMFRATVFALLSLFVFGCGNPQNNELVQELDRFFSSQFAPDEPGGAVLIQKGNTILFEKGYGLADLITKEDITSNTLFNVGSISKTFTAYGILILLQEGKLSLEDDLYRYFPEFKNKELAKKIKIYHLLTHTSGIIDSRKTREDSVFYLTADDAQNFYPITQNDSLAFEPGERFQYSNPAFNGLALIIERVSGEKWQEFVRKRIFVSANMPTSTITDGAHPQTGVAHGYVKVNDRFVEADYGEVPTFCAAGNGGVWSSVRELANYELAIRNATFLSRKLVKKSREVFWPKNWESDQPPQLGLSWFISDWNGLKQVGHTGSQGGFRADYVSFPEKEILYVCLCNTPKPLQMFRRKVFQILQKYGLLP